MILQFYAAFQNPRAQAYNRNILWKVDLGPIDDVSAKEVLTSHKSSSIPHSWPLNDIMPGGAQEAHIKQKSLSLTGNCLCELHRPGAGRSSANVKLCSSVRRLYTACCPYINAAFLVGNRVVIATLPPA